MYTIAELGAGTGADAGRGAGSGASGCEYACAGAGRGAGDDALASISDGVSKLCIRAVHRYMCCHVAC